MKKLLNLLSQMKNEKGQGMVEYGLIIGLIAIAVVVTLGLLGDQVNAIFTSITTALTP